MSLLTLVEYAQRGFHGISRSTIESTGGAFVPPTSQVLVQQPRPLIPDWLRKRQADQDAPTGHHT